jgi:hypothetical protein
VPQPPSLTPLRVVTVPVTVMTVMADVIEATEVIETLPVAGKRSAGGALVVMPPGTAPLGNGTGSSAHADRR